MNDSTLSELEKEAQMFEDAICSLVSLHESPYGSELDNTHIEKLSAHLFSLKTQMNKLKEREINGQVSNLTGLDRLVAEKVMNWEYLEVNGHKKDIANRQNELSIWMDENSLVDVGNYYIDVKTNFWIKSNDFSPFTRIQDAMSVLNKFPTYSICKLAVPNNSFAVEVSTNTPDSLDYTTFSHESEFLPSAICYASLHAKGVL